MTTRTPPAPPPAAGCYLAAPPPQLAPAQPGQPRTFSGVALSGQPLALGSGPPLVIDIASLGLPPAVPVLLQHAREQRVGLATLAARDDRLHASGRLLSNDLAQALAADADEGFPWQLSVHVEGGQMAALAADATVTVNGRALAGPLLVWRQARVRELSFTPTGVDDQTSALILSLLHPPASNPMTDPLPAAGTPAVVPPTPADLTALEAKLAAAETRIQAAEQALAQAVQARRQATLTQAFAALSLTPPALSLPYWLALSDEALDALLADLRLAAERGAATPGLFAEQATAGRATAGDTALIDRMAQL